MKLCMMAYTMFRRPELFDLRDMFDLTAELGMDAIELNSIPGVSVEEMQSLVNAYGLTVACYTFFADLCKPDLDAVKRGIENAVKLDAKIAMIFTPPLEGFSREEQQHAQIPGLQQATVIARDAGITLTVENFPGAKSPVITSDDVLALIREVPDLRLTFDNGNVLTGGEDPAYSFCRTAPYAVHTHCKDWSLAEPGQGLLGLDNRWYQGALIGEGIIDHRQVFSAMRAERYAGYISIEYEGDRYHPAEAVRKAKAYLDAISLSSVDTFSTK